MNWLFGGPGKPRSPVVVALLVLVAALVVRADDPAGLSRLRDFAFDQFQRTKPRVVDDELPVRIVDIDEPSLAQFGQWPWPRTLLAQLTDRLTEKGAAVVAFDIVFAEPDRTSLGALVQQLPVDERTSQLRQLMAALPDSDRLFAEALERSTAVLGFGFDAKGAHEASKRFHGVAHNTGEAEVGSVPDLIRHFVPQQPGVVKTLPMLENAAKGNGSVTTDVEGAIVRHVPMLFRLAGQRDEDLYPALSIETIRVVQGASTYLVRWSGAQGFEAFGERTGIGAIRVGEVNVETDARGRVALYDSGHRPERFVSAAAVLNDTVPPDKIEAHIVFIGTSAVGLKDLRNTPTQSSMPGVEIHAQIVEQMLTQVYLGRPDYADGAEFLYLAAIGLLFVFLMPRLSAGRMAVVAVVFVGAGLAVPWVAFDQARLLFDPIYPSATLATIYVGGSALAFMRTEKERAEIRSAFGLYLSPDIVEQVARNPELLKLGGELREITVMFTDLRGFTTISEQFDPPGLTRFMNRFLTPMTDTIMGKNGTIDKYMGDAIMAFWNAPLAVPGHPARACEAALAMQARLRDLNVTWKTEAEAEGRRHIPVNIGIGLNTGPASVGNFGSTQRLTYSCIGDDVNLASRLEGQCKDYAVGIIIGDKTCRQVPDFATVELDLIMVKGKTEPERIHALIGDVALAQTAGYRALVAQQEKFLELYRSGAFAEALEEIDACIAAAAAAGWQQGYYEMMRARVDGLIDDSPPDWKGVYVAKTK
ncbi:MAG: adenylate/guanylate cyclase domain-containing protein [Enhydrobacter sp.]|nr:MAG: adenylate/guanylate cyclase domain-containing protein [Enhydrobacter sp.]